MPKRIQLVLSIKATIEDSYCILNPGSDQFLNLLVIAKTTALIITNFLFKSLTQLINYSVCLLIS